MIKDIIKQLRKFNNDRNWGNDHNPKDLSMALAIEASELMDLFLWKTRKESWNFNEKIKEEIADIFIYLLILSDKFKIDLIEAANEKIEINRIKYPI